MISIKDIIKFSDYIDIHLVTDECFTYIVGEKKFNIKGINVKKYISLIFYKLYQPNYVYDLFRIIDNNKNNIENENADVTEGDFLTIVNKLYNLGVIQILNKNDLLEDDGEVVNNFKLFRITNKNIYDAVKFKSITIINFLNPKDVYSFLVGLKRIPFSTINLINFYSDIADMPTESFLNFDSKNVRIAYQKYSNILNLKEKLSESDFLVTLHSAPNIEINSYINECSIQCRTPWLNCTVNDICIEVGPLVVYKKTACYDCYKYMNEMQEEKTYSNCKNNSNEFTIKTYKISRISNLYIAFGYIMDEILKYFCYEDIISIPATIDNIITIKGLNLSYSIKPIIKIPKCKTCGR